MSYKKQSPFANFRDPKRATRNFNPTDFQMPDINSIFNKTADGENVEEPKKKDDTDPENDINGPLLDDIKKNQKEEVEDVTRRSLRRDRRAEEKEINKKIRQARGLKNASTKDITAEQRGEAANKFFELKDEKAFRKRAKKAGFNPEDYRNLKVEPSKVLAKKFEKENISPGAEANVVTNANSGRFKSDDYSNFDLDNYIPETNIKKEPEKEIDDLMGKLGVRDAANVTKLKTNIPIDARRMAIATKLGYTKPQSAIFGSADEDTEDFNTSMKRNKKEMEDLRISKGFNMKQVNSKGSGFPMIQPNQNMAQQQQVQNKVIHLLTILILLNQ